MAKFSNSKAKAKSPTSALRNETEPTGSTYNGAAGYARTPESEAFLLATGGFLGGEETFYESGSDRDTRFKILIRGLAISNPDWTARFLSWLRRNGNIRTAAIIGAAEYVWARRDKQGHNDNHPTPTMSTRDVVAGVLSRPDEPQEILGYWMNRYGKAIPKPLKRGISDAIQSLYYQHSVLKYDSEKHRQIRMGDVLNIVHPKASTPDQDALYRYILARRYGRVDDDALEGLNVVRENARLKAMNKEEFRNTIISDPGIIGRAGFTWEMVAGVLQGEMDGRVWETLIPRMGYMAMLRNLRNFDNAGIDGWAVKLVEDKLSDPENVATSKQFPFRFLNAYNAVKDNLRWASILEQALNHSLANVPRLDGDTLVLVDRSGSMWAKMSGHSDMTWADAAAVFGSAVALRAEKADLVQFGTSSRRIPFNRGMSLLTMIGRFGPMGGTQLVEAVRSNLKPTHTRVVIITDEQVSPGYLSSSWHWQNSEETKVNDVIPPDVKMYMWNFGGYKHGAAPAGGENRHCFGGLTDSAFRMMSMIESGMDGTWPWETE